MKTYNRVPISVSVPSTSQLAIKYFNYTSWKGKCTNKNYIGVDQETFEDCKNVYIDEDNVLRSRPSIKVAKTDKIYQSVNKIYTFGPWTVYKRATGNDTTTTNLNFVNGDISKTMPGVPKDCNVVLADEKIFVFGNNFAKYFDLVKHTVANATDLIYSPVTKTIDSAGEHELESPNVWSKTHRERYFWSRKVPIDLDELIGQKVTVEIDGSDEYTVDSFQKYQEYIVSKPLLENLGTDTLYLPIVDFTTDFTPIRADSDNGTPMISVSKYNSVVRAKKTTKTVNGKSYTYYEVEYSVDGTIFNNLSTLPWNDNKPYDCYYIPRFSNDGTLVYVYTSAGVYAISVLSDSAGGSYRYIDWTNLCSSLYQIPSDITYSEFGYAYVDTYNTFSVYTGIRSINDTTYAVYMVRDGALVTKSNFYSADDEAKYYQQYSKLICNNTNTMLYVPYEGPLGQLYYYIQVFKEAADTPVDYHLRGSGTLSRSDVLYKTDVYKTAAGLNMIAHSSDTTLIVVSYNTLGLTVESRIDASVATPIVAENDSSILAKNAYIYNKYVVNLDSDAPIAVRNNYIYYLKKTQTDTSGHLSKYDVYSSYFDKNVLFTKTIVDKEEIDYHFDCEAALSNYYISKGKDLYISKTGAYQSHDFEWYFPEVFIKHFDYEITGLHPISTTEVAAFTQNSIYYIVPTTVTRNEVEQKVFNYYKSRIPLGCEKGCDIVTSYDGKYTIFPTKRGLVAMAYQDFVSSSEQALTFLSDNIADEFFNWNQGAVKITMYKYWAVIYRLDTPIAYVLDMRNMSWWTMEYAVVQQVVEINKKLHVLSKTFVYVLNTDEVDYRDDIGKIEWSLTSQKLHFNAVNYYKQIQNLTLSAVSQIDAIENPIAYSLGVNGKLDITNYRKTLSGETDQSIHYQVNLTRTYVARLNYLKVNEFQFTIRSYENQASQLPLMLTNIAIKFKITGQVR